MLLKKPDDTLGFSYSEKWISGKDSFVLSPALPLQKDEFNNRLTKAYFDNLLPEGDTLKLFEQILKKSFEDPYQLLESYGLDCAGALEITPLDEAPETVLKGDLEEISFEEIDRVINNKESLYVHSLVSHKGRFSLAGAQDKIPVIFQSGKIFLPADARPTTHILKPPTRISGVLNSVQNEYLCMRLAGLCGLSIPAIQLVGEEHLLFLVERYDRKIEKNGTVERLHQFDLCQAQGVPSAEKYEEGGGPSFAQNYKVVGDISDNKIQDLEAILKWLAFNLLVGNNDSHSKNLSFLYVDGHTQLAPMYDLLSTSIYKNMSSAFAFSVGGQRQPAKMKKKNFEMLAEELGFSKKKDIFVKTLKEMSVLVEEKVETLWSEIADDDRFKYIKGNLRGEIQSRLNLYKSVR
ncbi:Toxin module HipA, protein kinase of phosphatidylinositol 3/4-kinase superfamily [Bdellovibrio bacteriovorus str. Tiberius]|uniref:Toxin module HipA, protein kinase of phosphatidylinositol 3/4-kinase superfamily n=1 Tax=Bdellovibrio bacteriovorus str. Tiberius TaxID=1069642 RepID=K7YXD6_BDEBC|nr:Toxin module HipA, protein kinase of phosphatidylinositol 3/4-kinase superfamily [Bdellovibrio bacteriovorus str. Tiberius]